MNLRWYVAIVGALVAATALVFLVGVPMSALDSAGTSVSCGTATRPDEQAAADYRLHQQERAIEATLDPVTEKPTGPGEPTTGGHMPITPPDCGGTIELRRMWTICLGVAGLVALVVAVVTMRPRGPMTADGAEPRNPTTSAPRF
jgi:uncharacterized membrane protein